MKSRMIKNLLCIVLLFCAIWSREPFKMIMSSILLHFVFKYFIGDEKVIGKEIVEKNVPIRFIGFPKGKI